MIYICDHFCVLFSNKGYIDDNKPASDIDGKSDSTSGSRVSLLKNPFSKNTTVKPFIPEPEVLYLNLNLIYTTCLIYINYYMCTG